jgi:hypothetical protein
MWLFCSALISALKQVLPSSILSAPPSMHQRTNLPKPAMGLIKNLSTYFLTPV